MSQEEDSTTLLMKRIQNVYDFTCFSWSEIQRWIRGI